MRQTGRTTEEMSEANPQTMTVAELLAKARAAKTAEGRKRGSKVARKAANARWKAYRAQKKQSASG